MSKIIVFGVILVVMATLVGAQEDITQPSVSLNPAPEVVEQQNRLLIAEVSRQIRDMKVEISTELKTYQDENFRALDGRVDGFIIDARTKLMLGGLGVMLIANAIIALLIQRNMRRYSYETYLEGQMDPTQMLDQDVEAYGEGFDEMQKTDWYPQEPQERLGQVYGQEQASQMTAMNEWQTQPAYQGAWESPIEAQPEYSHYPEGHQLVEPPQAEERPLVVEEPEQIETEDPLESPGWSPG